MANWVNLLDIIYPVGSLYMSMNATSPATLIGGNWEQIIDRFLLPSTSSSIINDKGYYHFHGLSDEGGALIDLGSGSSDKTYLVINSSPSGKLSNFTPDYHRYWKTSAQGNASETYYTPTALSGRTDYYGYGDDEPLMPPYITIYCWRRIS